MGHLVLSRKRMERVILWGPGLESPIAVTLIDIRGDKARLGFQAPREISIAREEVAQAWVVSALDGQVAKDEKSEQGARP